MRVLVLDNGDPCLGNLLNPLQELGAECVVRPSDSLSIDQIRELKPHRILMSSGPGAPQETGVCLEIVFHLVGHVPILGIGLGMQVLIHVARGGLVPAKKIRRKTATIRHDGKNLFAGLPNPFNAPRDAKTSFVLNGRKAVPNDLEVSAWDEKGTAIGCRVWALGMEGIQIDSVWFSTQLGQDMLFNFLFQSQAW
ncbi:MAG TPA: anthranilate/aminodeoxychorismate synthase component II [Thermoanaerobaculia bacterium]|nr:anthranilate/aminodeoxychorismate synthase component II [Thermoanaerobaculia bacterium]